MAKEKIVLVDDEQSILDMLEVAFNAENFEPIPFLKAKKALEYINKNKIKIVITDITMPEMSGIEFIEKVKEIDPIIQILAITGFPSLERSMELCKLGVNDIIIKPFTLSDLIKIVKEAIARAEN